MGDQRLDRAEILGEQAEANRVHQLNAGVGAALELEGEHAAGERLLFFGERELREAGETGIVNAGDFGMLLEPFGNFLRVGRVRLQAQRKCLESPQSQPGLLRRLDTAQRLADEAQAL